MDVALSWAVSEKILYTFFVYIPNQIVFGQNSNLLSVFNWGGLEGDEI